MTPKEKAALLIYEYQMAHNIDMPMFHIKRCALIAVDEIIDTIVHKDQDEILAFELLGNKFYWEYVKQEIKNL